MKKIFSYGLILSFVLLSGLYGVSKLYAAPASQVVQLSAAATTTVAYVGNGTATSTYQFDSYPNYSSSKVFSMSGIDNVYLYVQGAASSTATVFGVTPQFSNNGTDWYPYATAGTITNGISVLATTTYTWTPVTTATSSMVFVLPRIAGMHERVLFSASGAAGAIYSESVLTQTATTP